MQSYLELLRKVMETGKDKEEGAHFEDSPLEGIIGIPTPRRHSCTEDSVSLLANSR